MVIKALLLSVNFQCVLGTCEHYSQKMSEDIYHSELVIQPKVRSSYTVFHDATRTPPKSPVRYTK